MLTFSGFLENQPPNTIRDRVGLAVYYLQNFGGEDYVTSSDIAALFNINDISMGESAIATHLHNLEDNDLLIKSDQKYESGYYLSPDGMKRFERLSGEIVGSPPPEAISEDELREHYEELYNRTGKILGELSEQKDEASKWRRRTWIWRIGSGLIGIIGLLIGLGVNQFINFI